MSLPAAALPVLAFMGFKDKYRGQLKGRLGIGLDARAIEGRYPRIWVHALSLGEANAAVPFIREVAKRWPDAGIICSASTKTGLNVLKDAFAGATRMIIISMPFDLPPVIAHFIRRLSPNCLVLVETDLWPNLLWMLRRNRIPALLINGSISSRAHSRLKRLGTAFTDLIYGGLSHIAMQSEMDRARLLDLGLPEDRISTVGNIKYDIKCTEALNPMDKRRKLGLGEDGHVFVAGSTHKGEEAVIFSVFKALKKEFATLRLVIAPRDPARGKEVAAIARNLGLAADLRSAGSGKTG
ncbi:MAG: 3-deoxy-D-manno-octulosonic acid transferase, partial [Dissulfurimicrobium sp.]